MRENHLKATWAEGGSVLGLWLSVPAPVLSEALGSLPFDYINIDLQHGLVDYADAVTMLQAMQRSNAIPLTRVPWNEPGIIGKVLDAGAMGAIIPMVNTVEEAERAVASCRYAPAGSRSYGPARAAAALGPGYHPDANEQIACIPMIETAQAVANLDAILDVPGIDAVYVGPADLSLTLGLPPGSDHDDDRFQEALATVVRVCDERGVVPGIHTIPPLVETRLAQGFRMVTVTSDLLAAQAGARAALDQARGAGDSAASGSMY